MNMFFYSSFWNFIEYFQTELVVALYHKEHFLVPTLTTRNSELKLHILHLTEYVFKKSIILGGSYDMGE